MIRQQTFLTIEHDNKYSSFSVTTVILVLLIFLSTPSVTTSLCTMSNTIDDDATDSLILLGDELEKEVVNLFDTLYDKLPITISKNNGNIEVRSRFIEENDHLHQQQQQYQHQKKQKQKQRVMSMAVVKNMKGYHPKNFKGYFDNFNEEFQKADPMIKELRHLEHDDSLTTDREGVKAFLNFPFPLTDRIMIHWKYLKMNRCCRNSSSNNDNNEMRTNNSNEHMLIISDQDNESLLQKYHSEQEKKSYVLARTYLCCYWIQPIYDRNNDNGEGNTANRKIVGTTLRYIYSGDAGGSIPQQIANWIAPKTTLDGIKGMMNYGIQNKKTTKKM